MDGGKRISAPLLRPVTVKVLAEISMNEGHLFRFASVLGQTDRYALFAVHGADKISLVIDGKTALQFAEEIKKGVLSS